MGSAGEGAFALSQSQRQRQRHPWRPRELQKFLSLYFPVYQQSEAFARLLRVLRSVQSTDGEHSHHGDKGSSASIAITFDDLKLALDQHTRERLDEKDEFPLETEVNLCTTRGAGEVDELALPRLQTPPTVQQSILPVPVVERRNSNEVTQLSTGGSSGSHSGAAASSSAAGSDPHASQLKTNLPLLKDFQADVMKKSQNWLGRWQSRQLFLRWNELEICKKTASASFRHSLSTTFTTTSTQTALGSTSSAATPPSSGGVHSAYTATASGPVHSKRYPLRCLASMQLIQATEGDQSKKQALHLQFKLSAPNGGQIAKTLVLGCNDKKDAAIVAILSQIATFCLLFELSCCRTSAASPQRVQQFIEAGARVDLYCRIPVNGVLSSPLSALQLALLVDPSNPTVVPITRLLLQARASAGSLLNWSFASQALFSGKFDSDENAKARREMLLRDRIDGVDFRCGGVYAEDQFAWNLLMYCCYHGDIESAKILLYTAYSKSKASCLRYLDHVNSSGDTALHIAIKASKKHSQAEELAIILVDIAANAAFAMDLDGSSGMDSKGVPSATVPLSSSLSHTDSQLVHICDANGESVFHLALKSRLWKLVNKLVDCKAIDPMSCDSHGNNSLHLVIKVEAPRHITSRIIQLYRPQRGSAFNSTSSERDQLVSMLGYEVRERRGNDTALTLAVKYRQPDVATLLLSSGALADVSGTNWLSMQRHDSPRRSTHSKTSAVGSSDLPIHVAIKTGLAQVAASLVGHGASVSALDSNGSSPLALAIRFGMYKLAADIAQRLEASEHARRDSSELKQWVDGETGSPLLILAVKAGNLELASILLDRSSAPIELVDISTKETLLHVLMKLMCWLEVSKNQGEYPQEKAGGSRPPDGNDSGASSTEAKRAVPTVKWKRDRVKARSDGDLRHLKLTNLTAHFACPHVPAESSRSSERSSTASEDVGTEITRERAVFLQQGIEILVQNLLKIVGDKHLLISPSRPPSSSVKTRLPFHMPTTPPLVITDHNSDACTPLHVAAAGGRATAGVLWLMLAFLHKWFPAPLESAQLLLDVVGHDAETILHAALASNSAVNGMALLYYSQVLRGKQSFAALTPSKASHTRKPSASYWSEVEASLQQWLELVTADGNSPLHLAAHWLTNPDMLIVMDVLLQEGAYTGNWNRGGYAPLHVAIRNGCDGRVIQLFARYGEDLNVWTEGASSDSKQGGGALNNETESGSKAAELSSTKTPSMLAVEYQNVPAFRALVACGVDVKVVMPQTRMGLLHLALRLRIQNKELLEDLVSCKGLVSHPVTDQFGVTTSAALAQLKDTILLLQQEQSQQRVKLSPLEVPKAQPIVQHDLGPAMKSPSRDQTSRGNLRTGLVSDSETSTHSVDDPRSSTKSRHPSLPNLGVPLAVTALRPPRPSTTDSLPPIPFDGVKAALADDRNPALHGDPDSSRRYSLEEGGYQVWSGLAGSPARSPANAHGSSFSRPFSSGGRVTMTLDAETLEYLREEEKATLTLVAHEARREAQDWLKKRVGQKKLLSDAHAQLQSAAMHRRSASGNIIMENSDHPATDGPAQSENQTEEQLLQKFKEIAAKKFIDKHVAEAVADAKTEIEREKQAIFQETGMYPGVMPSWRRDRSDAPKSRASSRSGSSNNSFLSRVDGNSTQLSDDSTWISERGTSFFGDENSTWLSSTRGTMLSDAGGNGTWLSTTSRGGTGLETSSHPLLTRSFLHPDEGRGGASGSDAAHRDTEGEIEYSNPLDRDSFAQVIKTRNSLT